MAEVNATCSLPLVSVVIPTYNYGRYVAEAVESALAQTYPAVEVIVVDDGSTDDTRERLARYRDRIRYVYQENQGLSAARNTGIRVASGTYVALLDSDDAFHPQKLQYQMAYFARRPQTGAIATASFWDLGSGWPDVSSEPFAQCVSMEELVLKSRFCPSSVLLSAVCCRATGLFDPAVSAAADRDYWIRVAARFPVAMLQAPLTYYRDHSGSMSRSAQTMVAHERAVLKKAFAMPRLRGRKRLRRKALGLAEASAAIIFLEVGDPWEAAKRLASSFARWPFPLARTDLKVPLARLRLALRIGRDLLPSSKDS